MTVQDLVDPGPGPSGLQRAGGVKDQAGPEKWNENQRAKIVKAMLESPARVVVPRVPTPAIPGTSTRVTLSVEKFAEIINEITAVSTFEFSELCVVLKFTPAERSELSKGITLYVVFGMPVLGKNSK